jgi:hypothetical protein
LPIERCTTTAFYELQFSNDGGIPLEPCALEYNVLRWGYDDVDPPLARAGGLRLRPCRRRRQERASGWPS